MLIRRVLAASLLSTSLLAPLQAQPARLERHGQIPILAWSGVPSEQSSVERFRELADCGFTINFSSYADADAAIKALDAAKSAGVRILVSCPQLESATEQTVRRLRNHPGLAGYFLGDEPSAAAFGADKRWAEKVRAIDPDHIVYVNLFPDYASAEQLGAPTYQRYVDEFSANVPVTFLSFDYYPIVGRSVRASWYGNLATIAAAARKQHKPFWAFALSLRHFNYPTATLPDLREQVFSDLAYGAQGIQYFTYWKPGGLDSGDSPIDAAGKRTVVYDRVKQMNSEIRALSPVFLNCRIVSVGHTGQHLAAGMAAYQPAVPVTSLHTAAAGALISILDNGDRRFMIVVNHDIDHPQPLTIHFDGSQPVEQVAKDGTLEHLRGTVFDGKIDAGDAAILTWPAPPPTTK
jgi:hypothetical protein